jgi:asparagine synthase (glutamine-hydrolysing)
VCGIAGFIDFNKKAEKKSLLKMTDCLSYRGPDAAGHAFFEERGFNLGLGHRRLAIIDLSPLGEQPMYSANRRLCIIFNGEIYNYAEIKKILIDKGHQFNSGSDTEVILNAYLEWGAQAVHRFIGMFSFIIYDAQERSVFLCRDRAGVKPLYFYWHNGIFLFASELKSFFDFPGFEKEIDTTSVQYFFQYSFVPAPHTIFKNTFKLEPGHSITVSLADRTISKEQYWNVVDHYSKEKIKIDEADAMVELESRLQKACEYRMVSDVPVGVFLSGGYDSTLVASMLQRDRTAKIKTFTIGFPEEKYNEAIYAKQVADHLGTDHHEMYCTYDEAKSIIPDLPYYYDEPFGDSSAIPTILVSRFARKSVTVALSADGGDEVFAGYERHAALMNLASKRDSLSPFTGRLLGAAMRKSPSFIRRIIASRKNVSDDNIGKYSDFFSRSIDLVDMIDYANRTAMPPLIHQLVNQPSSENRTLFNKDAIRRLGRLDQLLAFDYSSYLPGDILTKVDRATMSVSLEGREPLLDHQLLEWVATLPDYLKYNNGVKKYALRKLVHNYVPKSIMDRPKMGFSIPLVEWFRTDLRKLFEENLDAKSLGLHGLINAGVVENELERYYKGDDFRFPLLWNVFMFQLWYKKWMV